MATDLTTRATLDDLYRVEGKAELIGGRIMPEMAGGDLPSTVAFEIAVSLRNYAKATKCGKAYADGIGYTVPELPSGRESFSPDASLYDGPHPINRMRFIDGVPAFAVEVRSENDYGATAEIELAAKRADYFAVGTQAVWDVDPEAKVVALYLAIAPTQPITFQAGETAHAEPVVPGWRMAVDDIFAG